MTDLRREIHSAYDVITPPLGGMPERVVQTVLADTKRRRKEEMATRFRMPLALVAALLVVAVIAAVVITLNSLHNSNVSPAGGVHLTTVQQLEARPLQLPTVSSYTSCPLHEGSNTHGFDFGDGPVYVNGGGQIDSPWGYYYDVAWYTDPGMSGPVLIRGRDLTSDRRVAFIGTAAGPVVGTDNTQSPPSQYAEMVLDPRHPPSTSRGFGQFPVRQGMSKGWTGCVGFQIDGPGFTEKIIAFTPPS